MENLKKKLLFLENKMELSAIADDGYYLSNQYRADLEELWLLKKVLKG